ncbi:hypothetical protein [Planktothrix agardhii]|uniref:hypothetical protein n=1 Tax=Planktothrix agardhii TaxID=1160 RepID=UPI0020A79899|nr:hypothetical protein [Planktothrix agardhii]CAD5925186.1 hypothetical protein NO758_00920 [Planktothrix agardhii]
MKIFVESAGKSPEHDYNWIDEQLKIIEKPNIIKSFIGLLQQDSPSLLIGRKGEAFVLIVTGISSERRDYQNRIIRISVAWILKDDDDHVNEAKIRSLASKILLSKIFLPDTGEIKLKETIENSVPAGEENGFDVDFKSLQCLLEKQESSSPSKSELKPKLEIKSDEPIKQLEQLAKDLKEQSLPKKEQSLPKKNRPLVVVTGIQTYADFKKANVFRGLAKFVDELGGKKEKELNFREWYKGISKNMGRPISQRSQIVLSVLAILFCISLALAIWFYIQSNDQNPNNQQQNDNINSSNKPIQTLIMEPNAVQKELTSQEKTEELKEEKIN